MEVSKDCKAVNSLVFTNDMLEGETLAVCGHVHVVLACVCTFAASSPCSPGR